MIPFPSNFEELKAGGYIAFANAIANEAPETADHARRLKVAQALAVGGGQYDYYLRIDLLSQGFGVQTLDAEGNVTGMVKTVTDVVNRLAATVPTMILLGLAGPAE